MYKYVSKAGFEFYSHQPYLEHNNIYSVIRPDHNSLLNNIVWEAYQVENFDAKKDLAFPDICADIMTLYTDNRCYCFFMGGTSDARSMHDLDFIDQVKTICGVKFRPGVLGNIFNEELCDAAGSTIEAEHVLVNGRQVTSALKSAETFDERMQIYSNYIIDRLNDGYQIDRLSNFVASKILQSHGTLKISDLAAETGYNDRYLRKVMTGKLGMNMKTFSQIVQMQWTYHLYNEVLMRSSSLADLAQLCGYNDQSHMNSTYKKLTGMLPKEAFSLYKGHL